MSIDGSARLASSFGRVLFANGQSTQETISAVERVGRALGLDVELRPRWGELRLFERGAVGESYQSVIAEPVGVDMNRVVAASAVIDDLAAGRITPEEAQAAVDAVSHSPPVATWRFALAAGIGAVALSYIYGVEHLLSVALIFISGAVGAVLRRWLARRSSNLFIQPFAAALLAGMIGGFAFYLEPTSALRLVAVCPCMILVPGPHFLNGAFDLLGGRMHLGAARLMYASLIVLAIATGLLLGLMLLRVSLPAIAPGRGAPLWQDVISAGVAVACFSTFFSTPIRLLPWPVLVGMTGHAVRTAGMTFLGLDVVTGALVGCFAVGLLLTPLARRRQLPFAALGFAAVVSMMPGIFFFRAASGLVQIAHEAGSSSRLINATVADGTVAFLVVMAMTLGLVIAKAAMDLLPTPDRASDDDAVVGSDARPIRAGGP
jgi:uncharacterized membrane protein YjjP (DUF1212 family)